MALVNTNQRKVRNIIGDRKVTTGTYRFASITAGNLNTGLQWCEAIMFTQQAPDINNANTTLPCVIGTAIPYQGTAVPVCAREGSDGIWIAYGF